VDIKTNIVSFHSSGEKKNSEKIKYFWRARFQEIKNLAFFPLEF